jgi:hypothetical protein
MMVLMAMARGVRIGDSTVWMDAETVKIGRTRKPERSFWPAGFSGVTD